MTPSLSESNRTLLFLSALDNLRRLSIVLIPLALPPLRWQFYRRQLAVAALFALATAGALIYLPPSGLWETPHDRFDGYLAQHPVDPSGHYRVAVKNNHKDGMVEFMKSGAVLANEFFTESQYREVWPSAAAYTCFLATRDIDHVVISGEYERRFRDSELQMLQELVSAGYAKQEFRGDDGTVAYTVQPPASARRSSPRDCHF